MDTVKQFKKTGIIIVQNIIDVKPYFDLALQTASALPGNNDEQVPGTPSYYNIPEMNKLQDELLPIMEEKTGLKLFKTYNYFRVYKKGDILPSHSDRPSCEISVTLCLGHDKPWSIFIRNKEDDIVEAKLEPGDGLIYLGCDLQHWRYAFEGEYCAQIFVHFVDQNGQYASWKDDKRNK